MTFKTPEVAALHWAVFAPPLLDGIDGVDGLRIEDPAFDLTAHRRQWLQNLDARPAPLLDYLARNCHSPRIGLVFESLWHFFLTQDTETELIANNLAVRSVDKTLGELDILYFCHRSQAVVHLELAVKYYLQHPLGPENDAPESAWHGPELRDRLDIKLARLRNHQLALPQQAIAADAIAAATGGRTVNTTCLRMQGIVFGEDQLRYLPEHLNPAHSRGWRRSLSEFKSQAQQFAYFGLLPKPDWLNATTATPIQATLVEIARAVALRPQLVIAGSGEQRRMLMITPDHWGTAGPG